VSRFVSSDAAVGGKGKNCAVCVGSVEAHLFEEAVHGSFTRFVATECHFAVSLLPL
jgi:hypothetical protein